MIKKILFFDFNIPDIIEDSEAVGGGGATVQAYNWILGLLECGQKVGVIVENRENYLQKKSDIIFVKSYKNKTGIPFLNWIYYRYPALRRAVKDFKPDFIYQGGAGFITFVLSIIAKKSKTRFIHRIANDVDTDKRIINRLNLLTRWFYYRGLKNAALILCQNTYQYKNIKEMFPKKLTYVLHNPFNPSLIIDKVKKLSERKYVAWIGIFQFKKNLKALLYITQQLPEVEFRIAGKTISVLDNETENALNSLKELANVKFVGWLKRSEITKFLSHAYVLLNTSFFEGFSNTFLESFGSGTPVITTSNVDPDGLIKLNKLGLTAENYDDLVQLLRQIVHDKCYKEMTHRCQRYVQDYHNPAKLARELLAYIDSVN